MRDGAWARADWLIVSGLALAAFLLFLPSLSCDFVLLDDPKYVTENAVVQRGLSLDGIRWAFTTTHFQNWLPITWLSHMLDVSLYGLRPAGHHATSVMLHAANVALLFAFLRTLTGWRWRSLASAALFGAHPLRVESVTWIAERKDMLAATFFFLTLLAYVRYTRSARPSPTRYAGVCVLYALGLMSKTMLVSVPGVLLLIDVWPLGRISPSKTFREIARLLLEKLPLLAMAAIASAWTVKLQAIAQALSLTQRLGNAAVSIPRYLYKLAVPRDLVVLYPHPGSWPAAAVIASCFLVVAITIAALALCRRTPYITIGWLWFLLMLVPVSGILQAGNQSMADRYTHLPSVGLIIAVVWAVADERWRAGATMRKKLGPLTAAVVLVLSVSTWIQQGVWRSTADLFAHALAVDDRNWFAHEHLGRIYIQAGDDESAIAHERRCIELEPREPDAYFYLALSLTRLGRRAEAMDTVRRGLGIDPENAPMHRLLGALLSREHQFAEADAHFAEARRFDPEDTDLYVQWAASYSERGDKSKAREMLENAVRLSPQRSDLSQAIESP